MRSKYTSLYCGFDCGFDLSSLWGIRIRGLWKLPDGRNRLWGKLGLVLMGGAMLSKSLLLFEATVFLYYKLKICGNPTHVKQVISQQYLLSLCLCHILGILTIFLTFSLFWICHGDMCSSTLVLQKDHNSWNAQMTVTALFLAIKYFYFWPPWLVGF